MKEERPTGFLCFLIIAKMLGVEVPESFAERFSSDEENTLFSVRRSASELGMKVRSGKLSVRRMQRSAVPLMAEKTDGDYLLLLRYNDGQWRVMDPLKGRPERKAEEELKKILTGRIIAIGKKPSKDDAEEPVRFGFRWFIPTILKYKGQMLCVLTAVLFLQLLGILTPLMTQAVVDKVLSHHALNTLYTIAVGILIVYVYELLISLCKNYLFVHTTNRIDVTLSARLFRHLFRLPLKYFETRRVGETIARVRELDQIRAFLTGTPLSSLIDAFFIIVYIFVMFLYSKQLTWIVIASLPLFAVLSLLTTPLFKKNLDRKFETGAKAQSFLVEAINGINTVKAFALEESFENKWGDLQSDYVLAGYRTSMVSQTSGAIAGFIQRVTDLIILVIGAKAVVEGGLTIGQLVAFRMLAGRVSGPVLRLVQLWQEYQQASLSVKRIGDIFNTPAERKGSHAKSRLPRLEGKIRFDSVRFRYRLEGTDVLHGISFELKENRIYGLVGRSGSGKSTISKLIQRLYVPQGGRISIDGMDLSLMDPQLLRRQIGVVLQESFMFSGTVAENISIHCPGASIEKIMEAAKMAGAHDFIMELEEGYDTVIGEKGVALSGGQKQRVAIARAIIGDPRILIFDEATSALDYESESIIQKNLKKICQGRTVIIIAHRLSTLSLADRILVIDKGQLIEEGTHEELLQENGLYASLYELQRKGEPV